MDGAERLRRSFDRAQQRTRWLGFPFAVMRKLGDDNGGALTTVVAHNAFLALFPLLLVVVTVLGFLLGRDSGFQQRVLGSAVAEFPIIGDQVQRNIHGLRGNGVGLVVGLLAFAWGARGLTQVAQHAMAEIWDIPSRQRPPLLGPAGPRAAAAPGFRRWPCRVEPADLAWQLRRAGSRGSTSQPPQGRAVSLTVARRGDHSGRMEKLSLEALARELMKSANAAPAGRSARTVYGGHEHVLRQTLMALTAGSSMSEHKNPGEATMHVLHGRVRLVADTTEWEGRDGDLLIVPQARHTLHALEDAAVLLTVAKLP